MGGGEYTPPSRTVDSASRHYYIIMPVMATIRMTGLPTRSGNDDSKDVLAGFLRAVTTNLVVPRRLRAAIDSVVATSPAGYSAWNDAPRFRATVAFGRRHEPWLVAVEPLTASAWRQ